MADYLTRRNGTWHFVRRVPTEFAQFDPRGVIRHSTKVRVTSDRTVRRATRVADRLNAELEAHWRQLAIDQLSGASTFASCGFAFRDVGRDEFRFAALNMFSQKNPF